MKKTKIALTLVCAILIVAASVMGTLAYLTDKTEAVTNTFTVGNVAFDADSALDEADVDEYGNLEYKEDGETLKDRVQANTYKLIDGHKYTKDPIVHMAEGSEDCYLFVTVDNQIKDLEDDEVDNIAAQMKAKGWVEVKDADGNLVAYVYYGTHKDTETGKDVVNSARTEVEGGANVPVFDYFKLDPEANANATAKDEKGNDYFIHAGKTIVIKAYAIQADGLAATEDLDLYYLANPAAKPTT